MRERYQPGERVEVQRATDTGWAWGPAWVVEDTGAVVRCRVEGFNGVLVWTPSGVRKLGEDKA